MLVPLFLLLATQTAPRHSETIVVTAERIEQPLSEGAAAVTVLRGDELSRLPVQTLGDALRYVPGLQVISVNPGAPPMLSSRGFFGAGEVEYLQLVVDGVAVSDVESGLADWRSIPIESIDRIEVLRGAGSSLFGDTALGGVVQVFRRPSTGASASAGSFGAARVSASLGNLCTSRHPESAKRDEGSRDAKPPGISRSFAVFAAQDDGNRDLCRGSLVERRALSPPYLSASATVSTMDGFRAHSATRELFANAALSRGHWSFSIDASHRDREDPGVRSGDEMESDPFGSHPLFEEDRDETRRMRASVRYRGPADVTVYAQQRHGDQTRTLLLAPELGDRATRTVDTWALGTTATRTARWRGGNVIFGGDLAREALDSDYQVVAGSGTRTRGAAFVSGEWRVTPVVRLAAGARWDVIEDDFEGTNVGDRALSPRIGASFDLGETTAYVQLARAFKAPTLDQRFDQRPFPDFTGGTFTVSNPALESQRATNVEVGVRAESWEIVAYHMNVEDEIDFDVRTFRYANIGRSRHRGVEASWRGRFASAGYAWTRVGNGGRQLKNIAEHVLRAGIDVRRYIDIHVGVEHSANRWLDDENLFPLDDATLVELRLARTFASVTAALEANNLFDERYAPIGFLVGDAPYYYPAAGRSVSVTLTWKGDRPRRAW